MKKKIIFGLALSCMCLFPKAQVGVNTNTPNSTLVVNGSFEADYKEIKVNNYLMSVNDFYLTYNGTGDSNFQLPSIQTANKSFTGRIYKIKNISTSAIVLGPSDGNALRVDNNLVTQFRIPAGSYVEVVNNANATGGTWDLSFTGISKPSQLEVYGAQLTIPPHGSGIPNVPDWTGHSNTNYDSGTGSDRWWIISKSSSAYSYNSSYNNASRMTLVYEYQGTPFNLQNMNPIITCGNNSSYPDVFIGSFVKLANNGTNGKTRLTVSVARVDFIGDDGSNASNWTGTFLMNVLLARSL
ncbi:hypothetical protein H3Z85_22065 [Chryseobacterium indologenes]|uniref:hypothetical protein n=1 Tax=Chryseobacterium indologenes TaxID=253 RepID=UPI0003E06D53|nr:hypothetical protein [Chryseobacterium indologenes]QPQ51845.1 hypothetical protein H3Z85_22065 [Chryseobacterium indologenes]GAE64271.1 hypothetical protein CIN01S_07_01960 [Chryseobacterium indologenes NBRC 14944]SFI68358.1 hypothetical protein SAMN05421692_0398 [Chryseobacterium indologenes]SUX50392.1 Uncharacterised protein [Chryseobacterium indologenes]